MAIKTTAGTIIDQFTADRFVKHNAIRIGTKALMVPNRMAPVVFASMSSSSEIGASNNLSNDRPFFSNVTVTESTLVVPKSTLSAMTPGSRSVMLSNPTPERMKNMAIHASGNNSPQLMLGGLR